MDPSPSASAGDRAAVPAFVYFPPAALAVAVLGPRHCRWPLGEPVEFGFTFCSKPREHGSYCAAHARMARSGAGDRVVRR